jgi:hypothetical protein
MNEAYSAHLSSGFKPTALIEIWVGIGAMSRMFQERKEID